MDRISLDIHAHLVPVDAGRLAGFEGVEVDEEGRLVVDGHTIGIGALYRPAELVAWMDRNGVARAFVSAPPPTYRPQLRGPEAVAWTAYLTDGLDRLAAGWPERLSVLAHVPVTDPEAAAETVEAARQGGRTRFSLPAGGDPSLALSDAAYEPLWAALDAARAFVFVHPGECADGRLSAFYLSNLLGNPYETAVAIAHLVFGGVVERFPDIRFCFAHGGGAAPMLAGRFGRGFTTGRPDIDTGRQPPREVLRRICVDCIVHDPAALDLAAATFGKENILFGSDWPFPMGLPSPHEQLSGVTPSRMRRIFCDNADALGLSERNTQDEPNP